MYHKTLRHGGAEAQSRLFWRLRHGGAEAQSRLFWRLQEALFACPSLVVPLLILEKRII